ncbi:Uncharacterized mitochondrial protein AtMg00310 [Linum grandiflorum]
MVARFWWGVSESRRRIHWKSWHCLSKPKLLGGLNFRDFEHINQSLLTSLCWRLLHTQNSLDATILKGRYFPSGSLLTASKGSVPSWCWSGILFGRELLLHGGRWLVGCGSSISTLTAPWFSDASAPIPIPRPISLPIPDSVDFFIINGKWDIEALN